MMMKKKAGKKTAVKKTTVIPTFDSLPELCRPEEAMAFLRVSRNTVYEAVKAGQIPSLKFGRTIRIPKAALLGGGR
jgi:excisionase family DNA binding protein